MFKIPWEYSGWSFINLRVLIVCHAKVSSYDSQSDIDAKQAVAARFWTFLADSAMSLEDIHITNFSASDAAIDTLTECLRGTKRGQGNPAMHWPSLQSLRLPLPVAPGYGDYKRKREDALTLPLHPQQEYALDLVHALKAREINGSAAGLRPLSLLGFTEPFDEPVGEDVLLVLHSVAAKVDWKYSYCKVSLL